MDAEEKKLHDEQMAAEGMAPEATKKLLLKKLLCCGRTTA